MCHQRKCKQCNKITWGGCGMHVDQVMSSVPKAQRCKCERVIEPSPGAKLMMKLFGGKTK